jgi:hypothetical protein
MGVCASGTEQVFGAARVFPRGTSGGLALTYVSGTSQPSPANKSQRAADVEARRPIAVRAPRSAPSDPPA